MFYTKQLLNLTSFTSEQLLHEEPSSPSFFYTRCFTPDASYTKHPLHQTPFRYRLLHHLHQMFFYTTNHTKQLLHQTPSTRNSFYTRSFLLQITFAQNILYTKQLLHQMPSKPNNLYRNGHLMSKLLV